MTTPAISIQLWTVRDELTADLDGTLAQLSAIGYHERRGLRLRLARR